MTTQELNEYVSQNFPDALWVVSNGPRVHACPELRPEEKALIYHYTADGFKQLNDALRDANGENLTPFGLELAAVLRKLPPHHEVVYRGAKPRADELAAWQACYRSGTPITARQFWSASRSPSIAESYADDVVQLTIISTSGRSVEELSAHGLYDTPFENEQEIIFAPYAAFRIIDWEESAGVALLTLEEV